VTAGEPFHQPLKPTQPGHPPVGGRTRACRMAKAS